MSFALYVGNFPKKENSTYRAALTLSYNCTLKDGCSEENPVFLLNAISFPYNLAKWNDRYYFVTGIRYVRNNLIEVSCALDVLATYKDQILTNAFFVSYGSGSNVWIPDRRVPVTMDYTLATPTGAAIPGMTYTGAYYLSVVGSNGAVMYKCDLTTLKNIVTLLNNKIDSNIDAALSDLDFSTVETSLESVTGVIAKSGFAGNTMQNAVSCIRSCIWSPFDVTPSSTQEIYLGDLATGQRAGIVSVAPVFGNVTMLLPWIYSDWRRIVCENITVTLPFVGNIDIPTEQICKCTALNVQYSYTVSDGCICYQITGTTTDDSFPIGIYSGSCAISYPIGINQHAGVGAIGAAAIAGAKKSVSGGIIAQAVGRASGAAYAAIDTALTTAATCIGGGGGGAMAGLTVRCETYNRAYALSCDPTAADYVSRFGVPIMAIKTLSTLSGYCQCANAHVHIAAHSDVIAQIDGYINGGFFIE